MSSREALLRVLIKAGVLVELPAIDTLVPPHQGVLRILAQQGRINERAAIEQLGRHLHIPYLDLDSAVIQKKIAVQNYLTSLSRNFCVANLIAPLFEENNAVVTAVANPLALQEIRSAEFSIGKPLRLVLTEEVKILRIFGERRGVTETIGSNSESNEALETASPNEQEQPVGAEGEQNGPDVNSAPVIKICNKIIADAIKAGASDIHVEPCAQHLEVRQRIDGKMRSVLEIPRRLQPNVITRLKLISGMDIAERRRPQDGRIRVRLADQAVDLRTSSIPTANGEKIVLRVLQGDNREFSFSALSMPEEIEAGVRRALKQRSRLLLTCGPTGSGKTTTLYTCLSTLNDGTINIETVENPIEMKIPGISQVQVNEAAGMTFASALRSILRQDPDVIMIGEIRDLETAEIAVQAAQTGHLVISTLHTNDAPSTITRLMNLGVPSHVLASSLAGVLAQRLVRKVCPHCSESYKPQGVVREVLSARGYSGEILKAGKGCAECNFVGYRGRTAIYSYLDIDEGLAALIEREAPVSEMLAHARRHGFRSLEESAAVLVTSRVSTYEEVQEYLVQAERQQSGRLEENAENFKAPASIPGNKASPITRKNAIPLQSAAPASIPAGQATPQQQPASAFVKPKVLIIDDDPDIRTVFSMVLARELFDVVEATNGQEGLERVYTDRPSLILCDLMMPHMDGRDFLVRLRANPSTRDIPVVILTAANSETNEISLLELGARDFISKGSSAAIISTRLRRVLGA